MPDLYGTAELAREAGVRQRTMAAYLARGQCPPPDYRLACGPIWREETVRPWLDARDGRLERIVSQADAAWSREVAGLASTLPSIPLETARRNVHNGRLKKSIERHERKHGPGSGAGLSLRGQGFLPTVNQLKVRHAEQQLLQDNQFSDPAVAELRRKREWAAMLAQQRQAVRVGAPDDGIPF